MTSPILLELYDAAIAGAAPGPATARAIEALGIPRDRRVMMFAFGKAAHAMASAAATTLLRSLHQIVGGVMVTPEGGPSVYPTVHSLKGDHPTPGRNSFTAATRIGEAAAGRRATDVVLVLISGGTSSLIGAPLKGHGESELTDLNATLLDSGLDIAGMNTIRRRFARWGGGRLALALAPAATHCLAMSDVVGDDLATIGSGPCVPDPSTIDDVIAALERGGIRKRIPGAHQEYITAVTRRMVPDTPKRSHPAFAHVRAQVIGTNRLALDAIAQAATDRGYAADIVADPLTGEASAAGDTIARQLMAVRAKEGGRRCIIWGGETTVALGAGARAAGGGGRCQELALSAARTLDAAGDAAAGITILAAGTDGRDGSTDAAGAIIDAGTWRAIAAAGRDGGAALARHESHGALRAAGALVPARATGTNVMDVVVGLIH